MEKTIKADKKRKILTEDFLNDNTLLQATLQNNRDVLVGVRFVDGPQRITEHILTRMTIYDYMSDYSNLVRISKDSSSIAIFNKTDEGLLQLSRFYDASAHEFALDEFIDIVYEKKFPELALDKHLVLKSTN